MAKNLKKIFVSGSKGFIGRNILECLGEKYVFLSPSLEELNLTNTQAVYNFLKKGNVDVVLHLASIGGVRNMQEPQNATFLNLKMFFNLVAAKPFYKKLIMFGSGAEYDKNRPIVKIKEAEFGIHVPSDQYGFYKYVCSKYAEETDFITHLRPFGVYGKYERHETRFISNAICRTLFNLPISINQNVLFDYVYIKDLAKIIDYFIENDAKQKFYNISNGKPIELSEIAQKILLVSGKNLPIIVKTPGLNNEYTCDASMLYSELPNFQCTNFEQSIKELFEYYKSILPNIKKESLLT